MVAVTIRRCGKPAGKAESARLGYWFCRRRRLLLDRLRPPSRRTGPKRLQNRLSGGSRVRGHARRRKRLVSPGAARFFGVGRVLANKRYDNHREHLYRYVVRRRADLIETIIPFFRAHPMHSSKQRELREVRAVRRDDRRGSTPLVEGLAEIVEIAETMNRQKPRTELLRILRGHTPNIQDTG